MFKSNSIVYDINIICKVICTLFMLLSIILLKVPSVLVFLGIFFLGIGLEFRKISILSIIGILFSILATFYHSIFWLPKMILFITYLCLLKKITKAPELRYVLEVTLYKFQSKKVTFRILYMIYFFKQLRKNMRILDRLRDEYGMARDFFYLRFTFKKAWKKTKYEMKDLITMNDLRFYNYSKDRTYTEKPKWERWDTKYLLVHMLILIVFYAFGRNIW